jgi:hypothetical protein
LYVRLCISGIRGKAKKYLRNESADYLMKMKFTQ